MALEKTWVKMAKKGVIKRGMLLRGMDIDDGVIVCMECFNRYVNSETIFIRLFDLCECGRPLYKCLHVNMKFGWLYLPLMAKKTCDKPKKHRSFRKPTISFTSEIRVVEK